MNFINSIAKNSNFAFFLRIVDEFFSGFRAKFQKRVTCVAFSIKFAKTNQKFAENSEFCENYSLLFKIIHWCPYSGWSVFVKVGGVWNNRDVVNDHAGEHYGNTSSGILKQVKQPLRLQRCVNYLSQMDKEFLQTPRVF